MWHLVMSPCLHRHRHIAAIRSIVIGFLPASAASCSGGDAQADIEKTFQKYRTALLNGDGEAAWDVLDSQTTKFYSNALQDALALPKSELERFSFVHKFTVLRLRQEFRNPILQGLTGKAVFVIGVTNGWISVSEVKALKTLHKISVQGRNAIGFLPQAPETPAFFSFRKE
jgi:hypothetical protein